jgi:hypothetical protein
MFIKRKGARFSRDIADVHLTERLMSFHNAKSKESVLAHNWRRLKAASFNFSEKL